MKISEIPAFLDNRKFGKVLFGTLGIPLINVRTHLTIWALFEFPHLEGGLHSAPCHKLRQVTHDN